VDVNTTQLTWRWGDGSWGGNWNIFFGVDPYNLQQNFVFYGTIESRDGSFTFPAPLAGYMTYYFALYYTNSIGSFIAYTPIYYFQTGPRSLPVPISENFDAATNIFLSVNPNSPFMAINLEEGNPLSMANVRTAGRMGQMVEVGTHDLSSTTPAYLSFRHACLMEAETDHGYVGYSLDGGAS